MARGRPAGSNVRQNIVELLFFLKKAYGYEIHKHYVQIYPKCTQRLIYYHLSKGVQLGIFDVLKIAQEQGDYSWGSTVEKIYYKLGKFSQPKLDEKAKQYFDNLKQNKLNKEN